jgi:hypothetical protein
VSKNLGEKRRKKQSTQGKKFERMTKIRKTKNKQVGGMKNEVPKFKIKQTKEKNHGLPTPEFSERGLLQPPLVFPHLWLFGSVILTVVVSFFVKTSESFSSPFLLQLFHDRPARFDVIVDAFMQQQVFTNATKSYFLSIRRYRD